MFYHRSNLCVAQIPFPLHNIFQGAVGLTEIIILILAVLLCTLGLAEVIHALKLYIFSPKKKPLSYLVVYLGKDDPESQLRYLGEKYLWQGKRLADNVIAVNSAVSPESLKTCAEIAAKYNIVYCSAESLCERAELVFKGM